MLSSALLSLVRSVMVNAKGTIKISFIPTPGCRICSGTGYFGAKGTGYFGAKSTVCRNCKYGGNTCMRAGTSIGECCDLPNKHSGPHLDREKLFSWYGGYRGFNAEFDNSPPADKPNSAQATPRCSCSLATIWAKGCSCGGT